MLKPMQVDELIEADVSPLAMRVAMFLVFMADGVEREARERMLANILAVSLEELQSAMAQLESLGFIEESWLN